MFLEIICARFVMGYPCVRHFVLYLWSRYFALFLCYVNITKLRKFRLAAILKLFAPKGYWGDCLTLLSIKIAKLKENFMETFS